jgi:hypothetical protein
MNNDYIIPLEDIHYPISYYRQKYFDLYDEILDKKDPSITKSGDGASYFISAKNHDWGQHFIENYFNLEIKTCRIFVVKPGKTLRAHIDCIANSQEYRHCSVNIPLFACDKGYNNWYNHEKFPVEFNERASSWIPKNYQDLVNLAPIYQTRTNKPCLFRTDIMHSVDNSDNLCHRIMLSMRFKNNLPWHYMTKII